MARGRQPSPEQLLEEAHIEAMALLMDRVDRDVVEFADLRALLDNLHRGLADAGPAAKGIPHFEAAARIATNLLREDVRENRDHRAALASLRGKSA